MISTATLLGSHTSFSKGIWKYGSIEDMPQYPIFKRFSKEGKVFVFSCDRKNYTDCLPNNCMHIRLYSRVILMMFSWLAISITARRNNIRYVYYNSGSAIWGLYMVNILSNAKTILFYGVLLHRSVSGIKRPIFKLFEKLSMRYADYVIFGSTEIQQFAIDSGFNGAILPIKKGVRLPKLDRRMKKKISKRIVWCGRLEDVKDPLRATRVFKKHVIPKHPDAELVFCGGGSLMELVEDESIGFGDTITVLGQRHDMPRQFQVSQMLLITSKYEGSPDICLEAMALGLPIVSTDVGGVKDYARDNFNGILCKTDKELGDAMNYMLDNPKIAEHMGNRGKEIAWAEHNLEANLDRLVKEVFHANM